MARVVVSRRVAGDRDRGRVSVSVRVTTRIITSFETVYHTDDDRATPDATPRAPDDGARATEAREVARARDDVVVDRRRARRAISLRGDDDATR
jgi:hypothetical protein